MILLIFTGEWFTNGIDDILVCYNIIRRQRPVEDTPNTKTYLVRVCTYNRYLTVAWRWWSMHRRRRRRRRWRYGSGGGSADHG